MKKSIKDYLQFHLGCDFWTPNSEGNLNVETLADVIDLADKTKVLLLLRRLESMTHEESVELAKIHKYDIPEDEGVREELIDIYTFDENALRINTTYLPGLMFIEGLRYLLSQGFDIFGLIDAGLGIPKGKVVI